MKKYSRHTKVSDFYSELEPGLMNKQIFPYVWKCLSDVIKILMSKDIKVFHREVKYSNIYDEDKVQVLNSFAKPVFFYEKLEDQTRYRLKIFLKEQEFPLLNKNIKL